MLIEQLDSSRLMVYIWLGLALLSALGSLVVYCLSRFYGHKNSGHANFDPTHERGGAVVEIASVLMITAVVGALAVPSVQGLLVSEPVVTKKIAQEVNVTGMKWRWEFEYPSYGLVTTNELAIPVGSSVLLNLSALDAVHSFWIPLLSGRVDLRPGQPTSLVIKADIGLLRDSGGQSFLAKKQLAVPLSSIPAGYPFSGYILSGQCSEYCGASAPFMPFTVFLLDDNNFSKWISWQKLKLDSN